MHVAPPHDSYISFLQKYIPHCSALTSTFFCIIEACNKIWYFKVQIKQKCAPPISTELSISQLNIPCIYESYISMYAYILVSFIFTEKLRTHSIPLLCAVVTPDCIKKIGCMVE